MGKEEKQLILYFYKIINIPFNLFIFVNTKLKYRDRKIASVSVWAQRTYESFFFGSRDQSLSIIIDT